MPDGAFARDVVLGPPAVLRGLWWCTLGLACVVELWLVVVAPGFAACGALLIAGALAGRIRTTARSSKFSGLSLSVSGRWYQTGDQGAPVAVLVGEAVVLPWAVFVTFRCGAARAFRVVVTPAQAGSGEFRRLRVRLRHANATAVQRS